jgi:hypothetical protein
MPIHTARSRPNEEPISAPLAIEIRPLLPGDDATAFRTLNEECITRHFTLEAKDLETLGDPENSSKAVTSSWFMPTPKLSAVWRLSP